MLHSVRCQNDSFKKYLQRLFTLGNTTLPCSFFLLTTRGIWSIRYRMWIPMCASALGRNLFVVFPRVLFRYMFTRTRVCVCTPVHTRVGMARSSSYAGGRALASCGSAFSQRGSLRVRSRFHCRAGRRSVRRARRRPSRRSSWPSSPRARSRGERARDGLLLLNRPHPPALFTRAEARPAFPVF